MSAEGSARTALRGAVTVGVTFLAFLLFAQFAFLKLLEEALGSPSRVRLAMGAMGLGGLAASLWTGSLLTRQPARRLIVSGLVICATSALAAPLLAATGLASPGSASPRLASVALLTLLSAAIGTGIALATVAVAADLPRLVPIERRGLVVGAATGTAYLLCNLPPVFDADPADQARLVALICLLGAAVVPSSPAARRVEPSDGAGAALAERARTGRLAFLAILISFLALVWLDSAAFAIIQQTAPLKQTTWGEPGRLLAIGLAHLVAALAAGWWIDRGRLHSLLLAAFGLFAFCFLSLAHGEGRPSHLGPLYAIGISLYSVSLVNAPSLLRNAPPARWRAALLYGVAGWLGSALGVGMAQDLHDIPLPFLLVAAAALLAGWLVAHRRSVRSIAVEAAPALGWLLGALALTAVASSPFGARSAGAADRPAESPVVRGRRVYVREGCINCHSQFVRPGTRDEALWGPARPIEPGDPPLIGMRRQGPDLLNAGNRRSAAWHRAHLIDPRLLSPGSTMPSYAHLFGSGDGEALVAYLSSLGARTARQRFEYTQTADAPDPAATGSASEGAALFALYCSVCHGPAATGDGVLDLHVGRPTTNLRKGSFWLVPWGPGYGTESQGLARVIKYGVPGTSMPGHEYLSDRQIADLAAYVSRLAAAPVEDGGRIAHLQSPAGREGIE